MSTFKIINRFRREEDGLGTIMALFWFIIIAGIVGLSVDATNAWRQKERLQLTADTASHAGILQVLAEASEADIRAAAHDSAITNMPTANFGQVINTDINDIILSSYNKATNTLTAPGSLADVNGVTVQLHRNNTVNNPVGTYLLQFVGFPSWQVKRHGTTVLTDVGDCPFQQGIWAHGRVKPSTDTIFGPEFCVHSQDAVELPQSNTFQPGSHVSMPNLLGCDSKCFNDANPGVEEAKVELNIVNMPTFDDIILDRGDKMTSNLPNAVKTAFWTGKTLEADVAKLQPLIDLGAIPDPSDPIYDPTNPLYTNDPLYDPNSSIFDPASLDHDPDATLLTVPVWPVETGYVVDLDDDEFETLDHPPQGLTYNIACKANGNGPDTILDLFPPVGGEPVTDIAVVGNCSVNLNTNIDLRGSMIVSTRVRSNATLVASANGSAGSLNTDPCVQNEHTFIFARSDMNVAAEFYSNNVTFMSGGDIDAASGTSPTVNHYGMSAYADGAVKLTTHHRYFACLNFVPDPIIVGLPTLKYIKQVMPVNEVARIAEENP